MLNILYPLLMQIPSNTPNPGDTNPIDLSNPFEVIVFIVVPILLVIFYFIYRKKHKDDKDQD